MKVNDLEVLSSWLDRLVIILGSEAPADIILNQLRSDLEGLTRTGVVNPEVSQIED